MTQILFDILSRDGCSMNHEGLQPLLQVLSFLIDAANDAVPDAELQSTSEDAGAQVLLKRAMSEGSKEILGQLDQLKIVQQLHSITKTDASDPVLQTYAIRTIAAIAASNVEIATTLVTEQATVLSDLLVANQSAQREAAAMLLSRISAQFPDLFPHVLRITTSAMTGVVETGDVERVQEALDSLLNMLEGTATAADFAEQSAHVAQLLQQIFQTLPSSCESNKWFLLLGSIAKNVSSETLAQINQQLVDAGSQSVMSFIWNWLYEDQVCLITSVALRL